MIECRWSVAERPMPDEVRGSDRRQRPDGRTGLLHRRTDNDLWALPGGVMELGESVVTTVVREVREETGLEVVPEYIVGVYSDPAHVFAYDDGEVRQEYSVCVACRITGGQLAASDQSTDLGMFSPEEIADLAMHPRVRVRVEDFLTGARGVLR
jgi:ADP-ribose pyrophosphatase YjhB (NUDIX family)